MKSLTQIVDSLATAIITTPENALKAHAQTAVDDMRHALYGCGTASGSGIIPTANETEIYTWFYKFLLIRAMDMLDQSNLERDAGSWPAGQMWHELGSSSKGTFLDRARETLGMSRGERAVQLNWIREKGMDMDDIWEWADKWSEEEYDWSEDPHNGA